MPRSSTSVADDRGRRALLAAVRALVVAEVGEVDGAVGVGVAAAAAVLGVARVLELGEREAVVVDAEVHGLRRVAAEVGDERVVGVEHEARALADDRGPAVGDRLQLAVAVELVAEQVAEQHRARLDLLGDLAEPELVDLEQAEVAGELTAALARGARQRRARSRPPCSPRRGCGRGARPCARGSTRPSPRSWSCRWWRRSRRCRGPAGTTSCRMAFGSTLVRTLPGRLVPPPRPAVRASVPTALAAATPAARRITPAPPPAARPAGPAP